MLCVVQCVLLYGAMCGRVGVAVSLCVLQCVHGACVVFCLCVKHRLSRIHANIVYSKIV